MTIRVDTVTLPAFLASALVNGDESGMCDCVGEGRGKHSDDCQDAKLLDRVYAYVSPGRVVSTVEGEESYFGECYISGRRFVGDLLSYVVHYDE